MRRMVAVAALALVAGAGSAAGGSAVGGSAAGAPSASTGSPRGSASAAFERVEIRSGRMHLPALIAQPNASGPAPAVVLLHGCKGMWRAHSRQPQPAIARWLTKLSQRGYLALAVDSYSPRHVKPICNRHTLTSKQRDTDALAALRYLLTRGDVVRDRIAALRWPGVGSAATLRQRFAVAVTVNSRALDQLGTATAAPARDWVNTPLAPDAALDANQALASALRSQVAELGTWVNTTQWTAPVYVVPDNQPQVSIRVNNEFTRYDWANRALLAADLNSVPLPPDAIPAGPPETNTVPWSDHELVVYQPSTDTAWELYHLVKGQYGWSVTDGGRVANVSTSVGSYTRWLTGKPHGMTASGIPLLGTIQRVSELRSGSIDHAVAVSIPRVRKYAVRRPATRTDGDFTTADAIPEGTRFRFPTSLNIDALPLNPYAKMVAKAMQAYGMVVIDKNCRPSQSSCPAVTFKAEDPRPQSPDPYDAIFGGIPKNHLFDNFPWDQLQVLP